MIVFVLECDVEEEGWRGCERVECDDAFPIQGPSYVPGFRPPRARLAGSAPSAKAQGLKGNRKRIMRVGEQRALGHVLRKIIGSSQTIRETTR